MLRPGGGASGGFGLGDGEALAGSGMAIWFGGITSAGVSAQPGGSVYVDAAIHGAGSDDTSRGAIVGIGIALSGGARAELNDVTG